MRRGGWQAARGAAAAAVAALVVAAPASAFDPAQEAKNFSKIDERFRYITSTPEFQTRLQQQNVASQQEDLEIQTSDPERNYTGNICGHRTNECAGDVRFYDWASQRFGIRRPVLFTARNGATVSGNVWATRAGPRHRPGIVLTTGSVQAPETLYWGLAATLAKHGYVVLTYDVQGQGRSDTFGEGVDQNEGVPSQAGEPFYDGTEDGLDFLLSSHDHPFEPRPSCTTGTSHAAKQDRRVEAGLNTAYNPLRRLVDPERIGIVGHSLGAAAVSFVGQEDPRVDALVAWDNLDDPAAGGQLPTPTCPSDPQTRQPPPITKPALGMSNDYFLTPEPYTADPDPESHNKGFVAYQQRGVDSMQVNTRGGTHYEYSFLPGNTLPYPFGTATLRGEDMAAWYTTAWFDRYVKCQHKAPCQTKADARLLTNRWRNDSTDARIDPSGDPNLYSFYLRSRYGLHKADGTAVSCDDMRAGCDSMAADPLPRDYSFVADANRPDGQRQVREIPCSLPQAGGPGPDELEGTDGGDAIRGRGGDDRINGGIGRDCLYGGSGGDRLDGGLGRDRLLGGRDDDVVLAAGGGADRIHCGGGHDVAIVDRADTVRGCEDVRRPAR